MRVPVCILALPAVCARRRRPLACSAHMRAYVELAWHSSEVCVPVLDEQAVGHDEDEVGVDDRLQLVRHQHGGHVGAGRALSTSTAPFFTTCAFKKAAHRAFVI